MDGEFRNMGYKASLFSGRRELYLEPLAKV
jgi:hypothetical protein